MYKQGDKVRFLDEAGEGVVKEVLDGNRYLIEDGDGFDYEYDAAQLVPVSGEYIVDEDEVHKQIRDERNEKKNAEFDRKFRHLDKMPVNTDMEIDLHIEQLIDSHRGMSNHQIVEVQMANFRRSLNEAVNRKMKKVVFIHGVGTGVLKEEIRKELRSYYPNFEVHDGSYQRYGYGATEVVLHRLGKL